MTDAPLKKMAVLRMDPAALREILHLPEGAEVVRIEPVHGYRGLVSVVIEGAGWGVQEGHPLPPSVCANVTTERDERGAIVRVTVDWGLPREVCEHQNTQAIDAVHNDGETRRCVDCGARHSAERKWNRP